jgi:hypothetical protein
MHLRVTLTGLVLGRAGRRNDAGIDHRACLEQQALLGQGGVDGSQDLSGNLVSFQQMSKAQDGCLVGQPRCSFQTHKAPIQRALMQFLFHGWVAQVPPQLQTMDSQHGLHRKRRAPTQSLMCATSVRLYQRHKHRPGHHLIHLVEKDFFAGPLGQWVKTKRDLVHVRDLARSSSSNL